MGARRFGSAKVDVTDPDLSADRRVRAASYAALAFAAFQLLVLPRPVHRLDTSWIVEWATIAQVSFSLTLGVLAIRGSRIATSVLGLYGVYRLALFGVAVLRILDGTAAAESAGPAWVLGVSLVVPFAIFWLRGAWAVLRRGRLDADTEAPAP